MTAEPQMDAAANDTAPPADVLARAFQAHALGELQVAFEAYQTVLAENPEQALALAGLAQLLQQNQRGDLADGLRRRALASSSIDGLTALALARAFSVAGDDEDALAAARRAVALDPSNAEAQHMLGHHSFAKGLVYEAHRAHAAAVRLAPHNLGFLDALAQQSLSEHLFAAVGISAAEAAIGQGGATPERTLVLGRLYARNREYARAAEVLQALRAANGLSADHLVLLATACRHSGQTHALADIAAELAARRDTEVGQSERLGGLLARVVALRGDTERAAQILADVNAAAAPVYSAGSYLPGTPLRLERLRQRVAGRDVMILAHGPSIAALEGHMPGLAERDVCFFGLNRFRLTEAHLLEPFGRHLDLVALTPPQLMADLAGGIERFLARPAETTLVSLRSSLDALPGGPPARVQLEQRHGSKLLYIDSHHPGPATPHYPLHFIPANSLTILLGLAMIGGARRIFVFGADGAAAGDLPAGSHYRKDSAEFVFDLPDGFDAQYPAALVADTEIFNDVWETNLLALGALYGVKRPPIYNVGSDSRLAIVPKISYDEFEATFAG